MYVNWCLQITTVSKYSKPHPYRRSPKTEERGNFSSINTNGHACSANRLAPAAVTKSSSARISQLAIDRKWPQSDRTAAQRVTRPTCIWSVVSGRCCRTGYPQRDLPKLLVDSVEAVTRRRVPQHCYLVRRISPRRLIILTDMIRGIPQFTTAPAA